MKNLITSISAITIIVLLVVVILCNFINIPASIYHIGHLVFTPKDLYQPIIYDNYSFNEITASKIYNLNPKYSDIYEIGLESTDNVIPASYKFSGKFKFSFFSGDKLLHEEVSLTNPSVFYSQNNNTKISKIVLMTIDLPMLNKYKDNLSVKVTIVKKDEILENYINSLKFYIAVSSSP